MQASQSDINLQVQLALERLNGRMEQLETWRQDVDTDRRRADDRRDEKIEQQPDLVRNVFGTYGGCLASAVFAALSLLSLVVGSAGLILTLVRH